MPEHPIEKNGWSDPPGVMQPKPVPSPEDAEDTLKEDTMTNTRFNKLWELLHKKGYVEFSDHGEKLSLSLSQNRYGADAVLEVENGYYRNVVLVHWCKERFQHILVD